MAIKSTAAPHMPELLGTVPILIHSRRPNQRGGPHGHLLLLLINQSPRCGIDLGFAVLPLPRPRDHRALLPCSCVFLCWVVGRRTAEHAAINRMSSGHPFVLGWRAGCVCLIHICGSALSRSPGLLEQIQDCGLLHRSPTASRHGPPASSALCRALEARLILQELEWGGRNQHRALACCCLTAQIKAPTIQTGQLGSFLTGARLTDSSCCTQTGLAPKVQLEPR